MIGLEPGADFKVAFEVIQHEAQVIAQGGQQRMVLGADGQHDFGLQRGADRAGGAAGLQLLENQRAHFADASPLGQQRVGVVGLRVDVIRLGEDGLAVLAVQVRREQRPGFFGGEREDQPSGAADRW